MAGTCYRERPPPADLAGDVVCTWSGHVGDAGTPYTDRVLPDGCVDVIWDGARLLVAGPDTGPQLLAPRAGATFVGIRMRPGRAGRMLMRPAADLRDQRPDLAAVWSARAAACLTADIARATEVVHAASVADPTAPTSTHDRTDAADPPTPTPPATTGDRALDAHMHAIEAVLAAGVRRRLADAAPVDPVVDGVVTALSAPRHAGPGLVAAVADHLGVTERSLHRRCTAAVGYGPKTLDRVLRFRRAMTLAGDPALTLGALAAAAGYADQAHLTRECRRLSGRTPSELFKTAT